MTGLDGSGKTTLTQNLHAVIADSFLFRLPYSDFVKESLDISGYGKPFKDPWTDRLLFAADARITNYHIEQWQKQYRTLISQRA